MTTRETSSSGFTLWVILTELEARTIVEQATYPERLRVEVQDLVRDYDAHLGQRQLDRTDEKQSA